VQRLGLVVFPSRLRDMKGVPEGVDHFLRQREQMPLGAANPGQRLELSGWFRRDGELYPYGYDRAIGLQAAGPGGDRADAKSDPGPLDPPPRTPAHACVPPDRRRSTGDSPPAAGHVDAKYGCNVETPAVQSPLVSGRVRPEPAVSRTRQQRPLVAPYR
jgi:hypothetical protein